MRLRGSLLGGGAIAITLFPLEFDAASPGDHRRRVGGKQEALFVTPPTCGGGKIGVGGHNPACYSGFDGAGHFGGC